MFEEFNTTKDLRVFSEKVRNQPGGILYAREARVQCQDNADFEARKNDREMRQIGLSPKRAAAAAWLKERCSSFTSDELGATEATYIARLGRERDPLYKVFAKAFEPNHKTHAEQAAVLKEFLDSRDPVLLLMASSLIFSGAGNHSVSGFVDGLPNGGVPQEAFLPVWRLAVCKVAGNCGGREGSDLAQMCAYEGVCAESREALLMQDIPTNLKPTDVAILVNRLAQIINSGDSVRLLPTQQNR